MHYENAIHRVRSCPSRNLIEHDVSDSATVVATTCGTNLALPRSNTTLWQETRYVMLLLNHSDRNASPPALFQPANVGLTRSIRAQWYTERRHWKRISLITRMLFDRHTRTHLVSHVTRVRCYFAYSRIVGIFRIRLLEGTPSDS